jgi:hypothetical protein
MSLSLSTNKNKNKIMELCNEMVPHHTLFSPRLFILLLLALTLPSNLQLFTGKTCPDETFEAAGMQA